MSVFDQINSDALLKFSHITPSTQQHLKEVDPSFALCMFVAAAGAHDHVVTYFIQAGLLSALGSLGLMIWLMATPHGRETALVGTALTVTCLSLRALYAGRRSDCFPGGILMSATSLTLCSSLGNLFFGSIWLFQANLYLGLMVMCGFVLFDTQLLKMEIRVISHTAHLFLGFVTLFRKLMMIPAKNDKDKKK
uniref:bax inhibitor 1-like n=1 Tax=Jaculus jaculus TaxID=51337 RepID=UPI001E1B2CAF|nr:bax inhibitor 1-like [Jaculus jaculus]